VNADEKAKVGRSCKKKQMKALEQRTLLAKLIPKILICNKERKKEGPKINWVERLFVRGQKSEGFQNSVVS